MHAPLIVKVGDSRLNAFFQSREAARGQIATAVYVRADTGLTQFGCVIMCFVADLMIHLAQTTAHFAFLFNALRTNVVNTRISVRLTFLHDKVISMISRGKSMFLFVRSIAAIT